MILDVPFYSQIKDTKNTGWKNSACGIACLKMVLDYYQPSGKTIDELYQKGLELNSYLENVGWYHHGLVNIAQTLGYKGIIKSWNINPEEIKKLKEKGFTTQEINILKKQQYRESIFTLKKELRNKHPIILSIPNGFVRGGSGHLAVLIGYDNKGFYFNDPYDQVRPGKEVKVNYSQFKKVFTQRAIFIYL